MRAEGAAGDLMHRVFYPLISSAPTFGTQLGDGTVQVAWTFRFAG